MDSVNAVPEKKAEKRNPSSPEEYLKLPKEVRDKAEAEMQYFFDHSDTLIPQALARAVRKQLEAGFPIAYGDGNGNVLTHYPDGRIFLADIDWGTGEKTETFLRMATPEDNAKIYD